MLSQDVHCSYGLARQIPSAGLYAAGGAYINEQPLKAFRDDVKNLQTWFSDDTARFLRVCKLFNKSESESSFTDDYVRSVVANVAPVNVSDPKVNEDRACNCSVLGGLRAANTQAPTDYHERISLRPTAGAETRGDSGDRPPQIFRRGRRCFYPPNV